MLLIRTLFSLGMIGIGYYVGKQIGRSESHRREVDQWRREKESSAMQTEQTAVVDKTGTDLH